MKKLLSLILATTILVSGMTLGGCGNKGGVTIDKSKTQLYVSYFNGGFGSNWIDQMKSEFETAYANASFEEGKTGVQIIINKHKNTATNKNFDMLTDNSYVFFNENVPYGEYANSKLLDITDVINGTFDINEVAGYEAIPDIAEKDIIGKFSDLQKSALNIGSEQAPSYYAIPHYEGYYGLTYDAELFDDEGYFMYADGSFGATSGDENLSTGPDGEVGTYDDGLPNTYADFFNLCKIIADDGNVPMIFSGAYSFYIMGVISALIADYNGFDNERLLYTFNGTTDKYVESITNGVPNLVSKKIENSNGYDAFKQAGYYYGLSFLYELINGQNKEFLHDDCFKSSFSHTSAQSKYILSARTKPADIAMLAEGIWWQNEATSSFADMEKNYKNAGKNDRNFKFMPLPKATADEVGKGLTLLESQSSYIMVRKNMPEKYIPLTKLFIQYCNTTDALKKFTVYDNTPRALNYTVTEDDMKEFSSFSKSVFEIKNDKNTKIIYQLSDNNLYLDNMGTFKKDKALQYGKYTAVSNAMNDDKKLTAETYFNGLYKSWKDRWAGEFGAYFN